VGQSRRDAERLVRLEPDGSLYGRQDGLADRKRLHVAARCAQRRALLALLACRRPVSVEPMQTWDRRSTGRGPMSAPGTRHAQPRDPQPWSDRASRCSTATALTVLASMRRFRSVRAQRRTRDATSPDADQGRPDDVAQPLPNSSARASTFAGQTCPAPRIWRLPHGLRMPVCHTTWSGRKTGAARESWRGRRFRAGPMRRLDRRSEVDRTARRENRSFVDLERGCGLWRRLRNWPGCRSPISASRHLR
jgi:hypothetical protein